MTFGRLALPWHLTMSYLSYLQPKHLDFLGYWVTLVDTEETVQDLTRRTRGSTLLNLDDMCDKSSVPSDD